MCLTNKRGATSHASSSRLSFDLRTPFYYEYAKVGDGTGTTPARPRPTNTPRGCLSIVALANPRTPPLATARCSRPPPPHRGACQVPEGARRVQAP